MARKKAMASKKSTGKGSSSRPTKKQKSDESSLPIMAPVPLRVYDPSVGAPSQSVEPLQIAISTESSSIGAAAKGGPQESEIKLVPLPKILIMYQKR